MLSRKKQIDDIVMQLVDEQSDDSDENGSAESTSKVDSGKSMKEVFCKFTCCCLVIC